MLHTPNNCTQRPTISMDPAAYVEPIPNVHLSPTTKINENYLKHLVQPLVQSMDGKDLFSEASAVVCQSLLSAANSGNTDIALQQLINNSTIQNVLHNSPGVPIRNSNFVQHKSEMLLPNDLIGCIIGRGGNKINEIRQASQANIKISSGEEGLSERRITITGSLPAVQMAQNMINNSIQLHKHLLALNLAMNTYYTSKQNQPQPYWDPNVVKPRPGFNQQQNYLETNNIESIESMLQMANFSGPPCVPSAPLRDITNVNTEWKGTSNKPNEQTIDNTARLIELIKQLPDHEQAKLLASCGTDVRIS